MRTGDWRGGWKMIEVKHIRLPLSDEDVEALHAGDIVRLSGKILVGRDAAHKRISEAFKDGGEPPFSIDNEVIYYAGPAPTPPGAVIGPIGPTTSGRMDPYTPLLLSKGLRGMIGKGKRTSEVLEAVREHKAVYFGATGGTAVLLADSVKGIIAQRLVRRLCPTCKQPRLVEDEERIVLGVPEDEEDVIIYEPSGCPLCNDTGYSGRIGVYEMMPVSKALQAVISTGATADKIEKQALAEGMLTLKMGAAKHVLNGITSMSEMKKIVYTTGDEY